MDLDHLEQHLYQSDQDVESDDQNHHYAVQRAASNSRQQRSVT